MAFDKDKWAAAGAHFNSDIRREHYYTTTDTAATVNTAGYFNDVAAEVSVGDKISAYVDTGGTPAAVTFYVASNDGTTVDVTDGVTETSTDSD